MHLNKEYGRLDEEGAIEYAPKSVKLGGVINLHPTAGDYAAIGYKSVSESAPSEPAPEGYHYEARGYDEDESRIWRVYETVANPPAPPRTFSCLYLEAALLKRGLLPAFDALLDSQTIENPPESGNVMPLRRAYERANELSSAHPLFEQYFAAAKTALGVDDETAEAILSECAIDGSIRPQGTPQGICGN